MVVTLPRARIVRIAATAPTTNNQNGAFRFFDSRSGGTGLALGNAIEHRGATRQTLIDDLTRLYNVRYLYESLDAEIRRARRYSSAVSVVFLIAWIPLVGPPLAVLAAGPEYKELARNELDGSWTMSSIAVSGPQLFIRTGTHLYCIGKAAN